MDQPRPTPPRPLDYQTPSRAADRRIAKWIGFPILVILAATLFAALLWPATHRGTPTSPLVQCASNLRQIGQAILLYANDHHGDYPDSLQTIVLNEDITPNVFVCPASNDTPASGATTQAIAADMANPHHVSYIYLGNGLNEGTVPPDAVVVYEPLTSHLGVLCMNVLCGDGHVESLNSEQGKVFLERVALKQCPVKIPAKP